MKIAACYSSRADYAPLSPVISALEKRGAEVKQFNLDFGLMEDDTPYSCVVSLTKGMEWLASEFSVRKPDIVLLLGDRYETLGSAQVATLFQIPIAHIHGGETTEGSFDNEFRHAITQLATYHFVSAEEHARVVCNQMYSTRGRLDNIYLVGAPGLDNINDLPPMEFPRDYFLVTYHPPTKQPFGNPGAIIEALRSFPEYDTVWTGVNNDPGRDAIKKLFYRNNSFFCGHMGTKRYLSAMKNAACYVGNSSSFLIEAPAFGVPSVNVGDRQKGRLRGPSVFDAPEDKDEIVGAIRKALAYKGPFDNPYGGPGASEKIANILMGVEGLSHLQGETVTVLA